MSRINCPSSVFRPVRKPDIPKSMTPPWPRGTVSNGEGNLLEGKPQPNANSSDKTWWGMLKQQGWGGALHKNDNCINLDSHLSSSRFAFWFPISPLIHRLCRQHLLSQSIWKTSCLVRGRGQAPFPEPGIHFTLFIVCISESLLSGTRVHACVWRGGIIVPLMIAILITGCNCHCGWKPINALWVGARWYFPMVLD